MKKTMNYPHRRRNPLTGEWVLVSPQRNNRPWQGATESLSETRLPEFEPDCPLCPGVTRANGELNPHYPSTYAFDNDFAALMPDSPQVSGLNDELLQADTARGCARVICFSPEHDKTLAELPVRDIEAVIDTWQSQYCQLSQEYACVHIFENKGEVMGCSQPHPHGQIWAHHHLSSEVAREDRYQREYFARHKRPLLADYVKREQTDPVRVVFENAHWLVVVPFWAAWPFETLVIAKDEVTDFNGLTLLHRQALAECLHRLTVQYDNLFRCRFPYSMGWHNAPANGRDNRHWRLHGHFYPPLLRSSTVKKHMVGYEMLAESQRDLTPEQAAEHLRMTDTVHYLKNGGRDD